MDIVQPSSRRAFVVGGLATIAATSLSGCSGGSGNVVVPKDNGAAAPAGAQIVKGEADVWEALVGSSFLIVAEGGQTSALLAGVTRAAVDPKRPADLARHLEFTALFEVQGGVLPEGVKTYRLSHPSKGAFELFLGQPGELYGKKVISALFN